MRKGITAAVAILVMVPGCYLDTVVRDIEMHRDALEKENANLRAENARLRHQIERETMRTQAPATDALEELKRKLQAQGIKVTMEGGQLVLTMLDRILFESGRATLRPEAKSVLRRVAGVLERDYPDRVIRVEGHTDDRPIVKSKDRYKSNWELSAARALSVLHFLSKEGGIDERRMYAAAYADTRPAVPGKSEAARAQNRRVQIVILPPLPVEYTSASR